MMVSDFFFKKNPAKVKTVDAVVSTHLKGISSAKAQKN